MAKDSVPLRNVQFLHTFNIVYGIKPETETAFLTRDSHHVYINKVFTAAKMLIF